MTEQKSCHRPMEGVALQGVIFSLVTCVWGQSVEEMKFT